MRCESPEHPLCSARLAPGSYRRYATYCGNKGDG
jgi:hypothetical protein